MWGSLEACSKNKVISGATCRWHAMQLLMLHAAVALAALSRCRSILLAKLLQRLNSEYVTFFKCCCCSRTKAATSTKSAAAAVQSQSQRWRRSTSGCISALGKRADMPPCLAATLPQSFGSRTRNRFWQRHTTADDGVTIPVDQRACSGSCSPFLRRLRCLAATSCCCRCSCACTHACPKLFRQHSFKAADEAASAAA